MDEIKVFKNVCEKISPSEQEKDRIYRTILKKHRTSSNSALKYIVCFLLLALILLFLVFWVK